MSKKITGRTQKKLIYLANRSRLKYKDAKPYPHIIFKNFFNKNFLNEVLKEFPDLSKSKFSMKYANKNEVKFANNDKKNFKKNTKLLFQYLNSSKFLKFIEKISLIKEKILADQTLSGGGLHEIKKGGVLKVHTDFSKHPTKNLDRRINVLIYLNKKWKKNYGGYLELWDKDMKKCIKKILPTFNTMVVFSTNDFTNHGHPKHLKCPKTTSRKSVATYYFSKGRPKNEITNIYKKNTTEFKNRTGIKDDVSVKNDYFKNILRNTNIYQKIKGFEKKYIRTGTSKIKRKI
jgi:Rps23 Pro-64 3,4-dihydroxylase Tpa1-like proline 4-hydroxylase